MSRDKRYQRLLNDRRWQEVKRIAWQRAGGLCEKCKAEGIVTAGVDCHHIVPVETATSPQEMERLCYDLNNIQLLCIRCHSNVHRGMGKGTRKLALERAKQRQDRWVEQMKDKFIKKDNQGTMQENKRLGIFGTLNYDKLKDMTMDERKLAVTNHAKDILTRKTKDRGPQIPEDDHNPYDITAEYTIMDYRYNKQGKILATFKAQRTDEGLTIELTSFESVTT